MPQTRKLVGDRLAIARAWYARKLATPSTREMARKLGVQPATLLCAVRDGFREARLKEKCRALGIPYQPETRT